MRQSFWQSKNPPRRADNKSNKRRGPNDNPLGNREENSAVREYDTADKRDRTATDEVNRYYSAPSEKITSRDRQLLKSRDDASHEYGSAKHNLQNIRGIRQRGIVDAGVTKSRKK